MGVLLERFYPICLAALAAVAWWFFSPRFPVDEKEFLSAAISIGAILTGFIATAKAILAALPTDSVMGRLRKSGYIDDLIDYLAAALYGCLAFSLYGLVGFFLLETGKVALSTWYARGWIFLGIYALLAFHRVSRVLMKVIRYSPPNGASAS